MCQLEFQEFFKNFKRGRESIRAIGSDQIPYLHISTRLDGNQSGCPPWSFDHLPHVSKLSMEMYDSIITTYCTHPSYKHCIAYGG